MNLADEQHIRPQASLAGLLAARKNPLAVFERLCIAEHYDYERTREDELRISLPGLWCHHDVSLTWEPETEQIQLFLIFDGRTPGGRTNDICRLMSLINERLTSGHFHFWEKTGTLVYRSAHSLRGGARASGQSMCSLPAMMREHLSGH